ncbi:MAG: carboxypeptidase-like regulatory domain-containing protein [Bacteroidales bacterium]
MVTVFRFSFSLYNARYKSVRKFFPKDNANITLRKANKQQIEVTGTLTDAQIGDPLPGVNIVIQGTTQGTPTDMDGEYSIEAPADATLVFSFVGYQEQSVELVGRQDIDVSIEQAVADLEEVVAIGYGTHRRRDENLVRNPGYAGRKEPEGEYEE